MCKRQGRLASGGRIVGFFAAAAGTSEADVVYTRHLQVILPIAFYRVSLCVTCRGESSDIR